MFIKSLFKPKSLKFGSQPFKPLVQNKIRQFSTKKTLGLDSTKLEESAKARKNASKLDMHDTMSLIMDAYNRRDRIQLPLAPMTQESLVRYDSFPRDTVAQNKFQSKKSYVDSENRIVPPGKNPDAFSHVLGRYPEKAGSSLTSVIEKSTLPSEAVPVLESWGNQIVHVDPNKARELLGVPDVQRQIRTGTNAGLLQPATTTDPVTRQKVDWHWKSDPMFQSEQMRKYVTGKMIEHGIDPHQKTYTQSEQTRIYNAGLNESLIRGNTEPNAVTEITPVIKKTAK